MELQLPRGIAVIDAGKTNTKIVLFGPDGGLVTERKVASQNHEGPPYRHIDPTVFMGLCQAALPELDAILPIDVVVPCAHGAAMACVAADGSLALPVMDYTSEPPPDIIAAYRKIQPPFHEVYSPLLPMALTHALQLFWQQQAFPQEFAKTQTLMTWIQYVGFCLSGVAISEISSMSCQTHLLNVNTGKPSSFVRAMGWEKFLPPFAKAWEPIGSLHEKFRGRAFRGAGKVLAGVHDSNGNYLRYLAADQKRFTLLSTGTWIIGFDTEARLQSLDESRGMVSNTDVLGNHVVCCRFFGGKEFEILGEGVPGDEATLNAVQDLIAQETFALPYFSDSVDGPVPHRSGSRGEITGPAPASPEQRASLASLYCALMVSESLNSIGSTHDIIVDGPFSENLVFLMVLAQLRPNQDLFASDLRDGTTAGAACLALMQSGDLPHVPLSLVQIHASKLAGLQEYAATWLDLAHR